MVMWVRKRQQELFVSRTGKPMTAHGGRRAGAGRKVTKGRTRASESHRPRARFKSVRPLHVVVRVGENITSLRRSEMMSAIRAALITLAKREHEFRVVHLSVQRTHIHLLVEAKTDGALSQGMKAFGISAAKHVNAALPLEKGKRRRGTVFPDRYHAKQLGTPTQVRNCIAYVLNNWRHHGEDRRVTWLVDPYSSAVLFDGWRDGRVIQPPGYVAPLIYTPTTWLLRQGWRKRGLIGADEVPGA